MAKKYSPSGYQIIDLTGVNDIIETGTYAEPVEIEWDDEDEDLETLHQLLKNKRIDKKPLLLKVGKVSGFANISVNSTFNAIIVVSVTEYDSNGLVALQSVGLHYDASTDELVGYYSEI